MRTYPLGTTRRSTEGVDGPLEHALTWERRTRTGKTYRALCGAGVYPVSDMRSFLPAMTRACPRCKAEAARLG